MHNKKEMIDLSYLKPAFMKKLKSNNLKNVIIQRGSSLFSLDSIQNQQEMNITIKKICLKRRPASVHSSVYPMKSVSTPKRASREKISTGKGFFQYKRQSYFLKTCSLKPDFNIEQNPFQNERLKSPISNRSINAIGKPQNLSFG